MNLCSMKLKLIHKYILGKSLILIPVAFSVDPDPEVSDPDPTACDPWSRVPRHDPVIEFTWNGVTRFLYSLDDLTKTVFITGWLNLVVWSRYAPLLW